MSQRTVVTLVLALALILVVMGATAAMTFGGLTNSVKYGQERVWEVPAGTVDSMKIIDLTGDGEAELFAQTSTSLYVYDSVGQERFSRSFSGILATSLGDVNGDGTDDILAYDSSGLVALTGAGAEIWQADVESASNPSRAAVIRFDDGAQVVLGDEGGQVLAFDSRGRELWRGGTSITDYIRGLDDVKVGGDTYLAAANHNGTVKLFDWRGQEQWTYELGSDLRRLRAYDLDGDGNGELLVGGDGSRLVVLAAATGDEMFARSLGQPITEIREAEIDGDPSAREFVVGGKDGGVWAFRADGTQLWSASLSDKVNEIAGVDVDDDGAQEVVVGDDSGQAAIFTGIRGQRQSLGNWPSAITRIDAGKLSGSDQIAVAGGGSLQLINLERSRAPIWYTPLLAGLLVSAVIAFAAWFIATIPPKPVLSAAAEDQSVAGLLARNRMLHESLADVERMRGTGDMPGDAYLARLRALRGQLADTQAALLKSGQNLRLETMKCPSCGGALPLGLDKCDYCGAVVIA